MISYRGFLLPLQKIINLLGGNHLILEGLNSILMVPSKITQQPEGAYYMIGEGRY